MHRPALGRAQNARDFVRYQTAPPRLEEADRSASGDCRESAVEKESAVKESVQILYSEGWPGGYAMILCSEMQGQLTQGGGTRDARHRMRSVVREK